MSFDPYKKENAVIAKSEALLKDENPDKIAKKFEWLLKNYRKLFKATKRLVKMSDRSEAGLKDANAKIKRQQEQLEKAHSELKHQNEILKENIKLREDVDRITRHDLKTPLNSIVSFPKLISKDNLTEKQVGQLNKISASGYKLLNMINLSLDLYKMEQGTYQFQPVPVDVRSVLDDIFQENRLLIKSRRMLFNININDTPLAEKDLFEVPGEKLLLYSMFANLIKNSLEAAPRKSTINIDLRNENDLSIAINNQGAVPEAMRDTFFEKYATAGKKTGTGLGTYSAKLIAETNGATIGMDSSEENGTTITVIFPK
jgi:two-component system, sensor histidine kinase and response regulator